MRFGLLQVKRVVCQDETGQLLNSSYWCLFLQERVVGRNFLFLGLDSIKKSFTAEFPEFDSLKLWRDWLSLTIKSQVKERVPLALLISSPSLTEATPSAEVLLSADAVLVDREGFLFRRFSALPGRLPFFYFGEKGVLGESRQLTSPFWRFSLEFLAGLEALGVEPISLERLTAGSIDVWTNNGLTVSFLSEGSAKEKLTILQLLLEKYRIEGKRLKKIDLRFDEPVVTY